MLRPGIPKVLDLNETISGMLKMLQRLVGEDIDFSWKPALNLWSVKIDPSQINQILVNLCVNARDAISGVRAVTIETQNVRLDQSYCKTHPEQTKVRLKRPKAMGRRCCWWMTNRR